jgi:hypothetical protein
MDLVRRGTSASQINSRSKTCWSSQTTVGPRAKRQFLPSETLRRDGNWPNRPATQGLVAQPQPISHQRCAPPNPLTKQPDASFSYVKSCAIPIMRRLQKCSRRRKPQANLSACGFQRGEPAHVLNELHRSTPDRHCCAASGRRGPSGPLLRPESQKRTAK